MKKTLCAAILVAGLTGGAASAQMAVFDASTFGQSLSTAISTANQVKQLAEQLNNMREQLKYQMQNLKTLDASSLSGVLNIFNQGTATYAALQSDANAIGFTAASINSNYKRLFAKPDAIKTAKASDYEQMYNLWQVELQASSESAMRAQANAERLQQNAAATKTLLTASRNADGEVRQLQTIVQMLGVIQSNLTTLTQTISTAERVTTTAAAAAATEKIISREEARRSREQYRYTGRPVTVLKKLP